MRATLILVLLAVHVLAGNLQLKVDLKQLPGLVDNIFQKASDALNKKQVESVRRDTDSHISLSKATIKSLKLDSTPKVSYKNHKFYLMAPQVVADVAVEFMDSQDQLGKAEYRQRGKMMIWGDVDLTQNPAFFNITESQVTMDIIDEDQITITKNIKHQPRPIIEIVQDLFTKDYQHNLNQELERALGLETHYQLGLLVSHFQDEYLEPTLHSVSDQCSILKRKAGHPQYYWQTVEDDYLYQNNLMTFPLNAHLVCSESKPTLEDQQVQSLLNDTLVESSLDAQLEVDDAYSAGLNAVLNKGFFKQVFLAINKNKFSPYEVKDKKVVESLVKDLHLNRSSKQDPHFKLTLSPLSQFEMVKLEAKDSSQADMTVTNVYNFTLNQTKGDETKDQDFKHCHFEQQATLNFKFSFKFNKNDQLLVTVSQEKLVLGEYFERNGYKRELMDSLEKTLLATYQEDQLFAPPLEKAVQKWLNKNDIHKMLFGDLLGANKNFSFSSKGSLFIISYQPEENKKLEKELKKIMDQDVERDEGDHKHDL